MSTIKRRRWPVLVGGVGTIIVGVAVLAAVGFYYGFGLYSSSRLDELNATIDGPVALPALPALPADALQVHGALLPDGSFKPIRAVTTDTRSFVEAGGVLIAPTASVPPSPVPVVAVKASKAEASPTQAPQAAKEVSPVEFPPADGGVLVSSYNAIYPGFNVHPKYWGDPQWAGADEYTFGEIRRPDGYTQATASDALHRGEGSAATRITIPTIGVDSSVSDLAIIDLGDSSEYETPNKVVGRIPESANPGETGNSWYFGHLESPIKGEGNVFHRLPEIPELLRNGDPVYVSLESNGEEFLYQVTATRVVHQDDLRLYDSDDATITLVACVPRLVYDHRIVVTGKLVGIKRG
ncbi:MAG: sortase [SAR202 cluster bacterium]|jgi:LPXTG-site transpeptidase (sortase) family protein|nr:sortase [SAR202 cluster bacterium]MDP7102245.1 sortase [SAR202 cluster bacterium]